MLPSSRIIDLIAFFPLHLNHQNKVKTERRNGLPLTYSRKNMNASLYESEEVEREQYKQVCENTTGVEILNQPHLDSSQEWKTNLLTNLKQSSFFGNTIFFVVLFSWLSFLLNLTQQKNPESSRLHNAMYLWLRPEHARGGSALPQAISITESDRSKNASTAFGKVTASLKRKRKNVRSKSTQRGKSQQCCDSWCCTNPLKL